MSISILFVFLTIAFIDCFFIVPERTKVWYYNKNFFSWIKPSVRRYARNSPYYFNFEAELLTTLDSNVTVVFKFREYLHNEYKPSFIELRGNLCSILKNPYFKSLLPSTFACSCPLLPVRYYAPLQSLVQFDSLYRVCIEGGPCLETVLNQADSKGWSQKVYHFMNLTMNTRSYSEGYRFPFEKGRIDFESNVTDTREGIVNFSLYASFNEEKLYYGKI